MSIMQPINAEILSRGAPLVGSGTPALATGSIGPTVNGVLNIHSDLLIPEGEKPSGWAGSDEFGAYIQERGKSDICFGFSNETGMSFETPFGSDSALVQFNTDEADPQLGNGLVVRTQIRVRVPVDEAAESDSDERREANFADVCRLAAQLNYLESLQWTDFPQLGRWHPFAVSREVSTLAHTSFVPNAYFSEGLVVNFALWAISRVRWARKVLLPEVRDATMIEILEERFGRSFR